MAPYCSPNSAATVVAVVRRFRPPAAAMALSSRSSSSIDRVARNEPPRDAKSLVVHHQRFADGHAGRNGNPLKSLHANPSRTTRGGMYAAGSQRNAARHDNRHQGGLAPTRPRARLPVTARGGRGCGMRAASFSTRKTSFLAEVVVEQRGHVRQGRLGVVAAGFQHKLRALRGCQRQDLQNAVASTRCRSLISSTLAAVC